MKGRETLRVERARAKRRTGRAEAEGEDGTRKVMEEKMEERESVARGTSKRGEGESGRNRLHVINKLRY